MIDLLFTLAQFCASCAPAANSLSSAGGLWSGAAAAAAAAARGVPPKPGEYGYADPNDPTTVPYDLPLQDDPWGNAIPGALLGPLGALEKVFVPTAPTGQVLGKALIKELDGLAEDWLTDRGEDVAKHVGGQLETDIPEDPNTFHMGKTLTNPDGSTINPDGTPGLPPNRTPAYNSDGTHAASDPPDTADGS